MPEAKQHIDHRDEQQWIAEAQRDPQCFEPLYNRYYDEIFRFIYRRTDREALTADLCSQTFYKALLNLKKYQWTGRPFVAWLYRIASNELNRYYRDQKPVFVIEEDKIWEPLQEAEMNPNTEDLIQLFSILNEEDVHLLELKFFEQKTFREIADILEITESTSKMRLYRLLERMKQMLQP